MAATQYQIFIRFFNIKANKALTNDLGIEWVSREKQVNSELIPSEKLRISKKVANGQMVKEVIQIRLNKSGSGYTPEEENKFLQIITDENVSSNPKYDMLFVYDGIGTHQEVSVSGGELLPQKGSDKEIPTLLYERMKRIKENPWFLYSTHASLTSAMEKAQKLVDLIGKKNVMIGKIVPLDQYIDIV